MIFPEPKFVKKVWGSELWIANYNYCGKLLTLNKGFRCSLHYHKNKDETFYIQSGKVQMEYCKVGEKMKKITMKPGELIHIPPLMIHRFTGIEKSLIYEFSTHHEDDDSYRFTESGKV